MAGFDRDLLVLIHSTDKTGNGAIHQYGTGYFISNTLVLTARHVLKDNPVEIDIYLPGIDKEQNSNWIEADPIPVWENEKLDAALIRVKGHISLQVPAPAWGDMDFKTDQSWKSAGYPAAASERISEGIIYKTSGLGGKLLADGGKGQGANELELGVDYEAVLWNGISGAPVFVEEKLVGIITSSRLSYEQRRLKATPVKLLLDDPGFRVAIIPEWFPWPPENTTWVLILNPEKKDAELSNTVSAAIRNKDEEIKLITGNPVYKTPVSISVTDVLENPGRLFEFIKAICAAPVMIFDVTGFEPAIMMFLGIRAVVRRGVTLTTTTKFPEESVLNELPFNIQEAKLIELSEDCEIRSPRNPVNWIGNAMVEGLLQIQSHPGYLDLPAYNAVRCPEPKYQGGKSLATDKALMLCSFNKEYKTRHWTYVSNKVLKKVVPRTLERMLDIPSPRLVGLALYESIRWTQCCIIDWTQWRPNVFFELGVRLASSNIGPICLIEEGEIDKDGEGLKQKHQLIQLLRPTRYIVNGPTGPFDEAFEKYDKIVRGEYTPVDEFMIDHNAIHQQIILSYYWQQESVSKQPHEELIRNIQAYFGEDLHKQGDLQVLFSFNSEYKKELRRNISERWIAAWYYLKGRYTMEEFQSDKAKREQLTKLGFEATQWLKAPEYKRIYDEMNDVIDELDSLTIKT